ncbi:hypothetical protein DRO35_00230 [Candidatus Bathyarchaeota archaeon]|nr:MAG: hypothetical protein DRO35_00230 [Candidatus Bathyarchaeota archaeon]
METDRCYYGIQKDYPHLNVDVPFKRRSPGRVKRGVKAEELTGKQKTFNRKLSREGVEEHIISRLKSSA